MVIYLQITEKTNKISNLESRAKELEEKEKKNEKLLNTRKEKITKLEKEVCIKPSRYILIDI